MTVSTTRAIADACEPQTRWAVRQGLSAEIPAVAELVTAMMPLGRQPLALTQLTETLRRSGPGDVWLSVAFANSSADAGPEGGPAAPVAAAMATRSSSDSAQLVGVGHLGQLGDRDSADLLIRTTQGLHAQLTASGIRYIQANWEADDQHPPFEASGYQRLARLEYLMAEIPVLLGHARARGWSDPLAAIQSQAVNPGGSAANRHRWVQLAERTFQGTRDCPLLSEFRTPEDVIAAYMAAASFDPADWRVVQRDETDIACLILTPHQGGDVIELTYMGIVPAQRGQRWGSRLMGEAAWLASQRGARQLILAVDRQNAPAMRLYRAWGLDRVASEAAWGRGLANQPLG